MFADVLSRDSHDDAGAPVSLTVHYGSRYNNAFWDGTQLVFGDGDGKVFERFTKPVDVLAHEFSHAVVEHTAGLVYRGQSGALNESVADVFASCLKQRLLGQDAADGDWLIGEGIFTTSVRARALRDMAAPGTAYDDPELGADPQVGHMDDYVETSDDNGGVHLNSGIPNKAFQLAAVAVGGTAIEGAGRIWYDALVGGDVPEDADFATFAAATVAAAGQHADAVREAWAQVGVEPAASTGPGGTGAGRRRTDPGRAQRRLHRPDRDGRGRPRRRPARVSSPTLRCAVAAGEPERPMPDMYVYTFTVDDGEPVRVPEHRLTASQAELARRVLGSGGGAGREPLTSLRVTRRRTARAVGSPHAPTAANVPRPAGLDPTPIGQGLHLPRRARPPPRRRAGAAVQGPRHPAGLAGRVDHAVPQRPPAGRRHRRRRTQAVPLPPAVAGEPGRREVRPDPRLRQGAVEGARAGAVRHRRGDHVAGARRARSPYACSTSATSASATTSTPTPTAPSASRRCARTTCRSTASRCGSASSASRASSTPSTSTTRPRSRRSR